MKNILTTLLCISAVLTSAGQAVTNSTTGVEYSGFNAAFSAAATGDVLVVNKSTAISSVQNPGGRDITIIGASADVQLQIQKNGQGQYKTGFQINADDGSVLTIRNLTITGDGETSTANLADFQYGTVTMENVTIAGFETSNQNGAIRLRGSVAATFDNVKFTGEKIEGATAFDIICAGTSDVTVEGDCAFTVSLSANANSIKASALTNTEPITLLVPDNRSAGGIVVQGCTDIERFLLTTPTAKQRMLAPNGQNLVAMAYKPVLRVSKDADSGDYTSTGYDALAAAISGAATAGDEILLNEDAEVSTAINAAKEFTVRSTYAASPVTVFRTADNNMINPAAASNFTFENLTIDGSKYYTDEATGFVNWVVNARNGHVTLRDVEIVNMKNIAPESGSVVGFIRDLNSGSWTLDGVRFTDCSIADDGSQFVIANTSNSAMSGDCDFSMRLATNQTVDASGLACSTPISLQLASQTSGNTAFTGCADPAMFDITNGGWCLIANNSGGLTLYNGSAESLPEIPAPTFAITGGTYRLPTLVEVEEGQTAYLTLDYDSDLYDVKYRTEAFAYEPEEEVMLLADATDDEWTDYSGQFAVEPNTTVHLQTYDKANPWRIPQESLINVLTADTILTGTADIESAAVAEPEYFNLQGIRMAVGSDLAPGIYIRRSGNRTEKILVK